MNMKGISNILPQEGQNTTDYINKIDETNEEKIEYYVPYSAKYLKYSDRQKESYGLTDAKINLFTKNGHGQITLEYDVLDGENVNHKRLVIATGELKKGAGNQQEILKVMKSMISKMKDFNKLGTREFAAYATRMQRLGWGVTNECIDIAQMSKQDNETEIKRTKFTQDERINMKPEDMEQESHRLRLELQLIEGVKSFIIEGYRDLYIDPVAEEVKLRKEEVREYVKGTIKPEKMLAIAFKNLKPIAQTQSNYVMERAYVKTIKKYLDDLPDKDKQNIEKRDIEAYYLVREEYAKRQFGNAINQNKDKDKEDAEQILLNFITRRDKKIELKREQKRQEVREYVAERIANGEGLDDYIPEDVRTEAQIDLKELRKRRTSAEGPEI